jgi:phosphotransferase system enzyme I (PtsI)
LFLEDPTLLERVASKINDEQCNAEAALAEVMAGYAGLLRSSEDEVFRQRAVDVEDVGQRVLGVLIGPPNRSLDQLTESVILVAHDLTPSDIVKLDQKYVLGFCTATGSTTSHVAILARSLGLPAVVGLGEELLSFSSGTVLVVDGDNGLVILEPDETTLTTYRLRQEELQTQRLAGRNAALGPATTRDGHRVKVLANVTSLDAARAALDYGAEGIGLLRTEFLFLNRAATPSEEEQYGSYRAILDVMGDRPVIFRTLDVGGDKQAPYLRVGEELNPFLGWRAIRLCLDQPEIFKTQLRAILRAGYRRNIKIMFPMVTILEEFLHAKGLLREAQDELAARDIPYAEKPEIGMMVESPAAAIGADCLAHEAEFVSIGTNDLVQYVMACDRTNEHVAYLYQPFHPSVLRLIKAVIDAAHKANKWVGLCGEMAGEPAAVPILLGLGLDEFSVAGPVIPIVRGIVRRLSLAQVQGIASEALGLASAEEVRAYAEGIL